jgi:hypothetical protein
MQPGNLQCPSQGETHRPLSANADRSYGRTLSYDVDSRNRGKGTSCENVFRISSWIKNVSSAVQTTMTIRPAYTKGIRRSFKKWRRICKIRRHGWRVCCSSLRKGRKVRIGTSSISRWRGRYSETTGSIHLSGYLLSFYGGDGPYSRTASSIPDDMLPDYSDSSVYSSQFGTYTPGPPFVPLHSSYSEQAIYHQGAYAIALRRLDAASGIYDHVASSYSRP